MHLSLIKLKKGNKRFPFFVFYVIMKMRGMKSRHLHGRGDLRGKERTL